MLSTKLRLIGLALSLAVSVPANAESTVSEAITAAYRLQEKSALKEAHQKIGSGMEKKGNALLSGAPEIGFLYKSDAAGSQDGYREYEASLALPVWRIGQKSATRELSEAMLAQAETEDSAARWQVASDVLDAAWNLREAGAEKQLAKKQWDAARKLEDNIKKRMDAGEVARADWMLAQQETTNREEKYRLAKINHSLSLALWEKLTGFKSLPADLDQIELSDRSDIEQHPLALNAKRLLAVAETKREKEQKSLQSPPVLTLFAKRDRGVEADPWNDSLGAQISLPIGKAHISSELAEADMSVTESRVELESINRNLEYRFQKARLELEQIESALELVKHANELAKSRVKISERAYDLGEMELFLLLKAYEDANVAASNLEKMIIRHKRASTMYNLSVGVLP